MTTSDFHLAQINIGRMRGPIDSPTMRGFVRQLDAINAVADAAPGFVWRLQSDQGNATDIQAYADPRLIVNMSVWDSVEALRAYVYKSGHVGPMRDRKKWFEKIEQPITALWWVPAGHVPSVAEGQARLERLRLVGPTPHAFDFGHPFAPPAASPLEFIVNVEGAVYHEGRYLMVVRGEGEEHAAGMLSLIGGKVENAGDTQSILEETLIREIQEEVDVTVDPRLHYLESKAFVADSRSQVVDVVYLCRYAGGTPRAADPDEVAAVQWATAAEILTDPNAPIWTRQSIELAETRRRELGW